MTPAQLKKIIANTGLNRKEFSEEYNFSYTTLTYWCNGRSPISERNAIRLKEIAIKTSEQDSFDFNMELNIDDFDIDIQIGEVEIESRYIKPKLQPEIKEEYLQYSKAEDLAANINIKENFRMFCFITGSFYAGDLIEALIVGKNLKVKTLTVATLGMNDNSIDSLANIMDGKYVDKLNLIVSHYFYSHECHPHHGKAGLVRYIYQELDKGNRFQLVVCRSHCKMALIELYSGEKIVIHGSANLRSSGNVEQIMIEENKELYDFSFNYLRTMVFRYKTIDHEE